ncbi:MAG TPA: RNA 2',3'-cyclic phosphodiesterase [Draconibacterium sp.]|nr:RNA 2',3'-cyclic phosphodiesterase [Draconibacterium sp.]
MSDVYRTFIALRIHPGNILQHLLNELQETFSTEAIKWVEKENLHLTLKFLGDTTVEQLEEIKEILKKTRKHFQPFHFQLKGLGYFKSNGQPRVLFAGIEDFESLKQLVSDLDESFAKVGFEKEKREFKPHLTLARIKFLKNRKQFYSLVEKFDGNEIQSVNISEIVYYQSILKPGGPVYIPLQRFNLIGKK